MSEPLFYDRDGKPLTAHQFVTLCPDPGAWERYRRVGVDEVGPYHISTVWIGTRLHPMIKPPLIFETMVFARGEDDPLDLDLDVRRWPTWATAEKGHRAMVAEVAARLGE